jgi:hypothetical protein
LKITKGNRARDQDKGKILSSRRCRTNTQNFPPEEAPRYITMVEKEA